MEAAQAVSHATPERLKGVPDVVPLGGAFRQLTPHYFTHMVID